MKKERKESGFTLIEVLIVIGIIALLAGVVLVSINPTRQFKLARDSQRTSHVIAIVNAIGQNISEHRGIFQCGNNTMTIPATTTIMKSSSGFDIAPCLVPVYLATMPFDPIATSSHYTSVIDYDSGYSIFLDVNDRVTIFAPKTEIQNPIISITR
ncbi:MAG: type II secretion system protein [Candidatus Taylorbacteria bacterium]|nr:type II secretion system protein [Candidatus Taylorbacteria bacterium]